MKIILNIIFLLLICSKSYAAEAVVTDGRGNILGANSSSPLYVTIGAGSNLSPNIGIGTTPALQTLSVFRNSSSPGLADSAIVGTYDYALGASDVVAGVKGYFNNSGSTVSAGGHGIGVFGFGTDTVAGVSPIYAVEGRVNAQGLTATYTGVLGDSNWTDPSVGNSNTFAGSMIGQSSLQAIYNHDGVTARQQGTIFGFYAAPNIGGQFNYGMLIDAQTSGQFNIGEAIRHATLYTLQVGSDQDGVTAANGITFGQSGDTTLYRSATSNLKTDGAFDVQGTVRVGHFLNNGGTNGNIVCISANKTLGHCTAAASCLSTCTCTCVAD